MAEVNVVSKNSGSGGRSDASITTQGFLKLWREIFRFLWVFKKEFYWQIILNVLMSLAEVLAPLVVALVIDVFIVEKSIIGMWGVAGIYILEIVIYGVLIYFFRSLSYGLEAGIAYRFRKGLFDKVQSLAISYFDKNSVGSIIAKLGSDSGNTSEIIAWYVTEFIWALSYLVFMLTIIGIANLKLALILMASIPPLMLVIGLLGRKMLSLQRRVRKSNADMIASLNDGIYGAPTAKVLGREELDCEEFTGITARLRRDSIKSELLSAAVTPIPMALSSVATAIVLIIGGGMVISGEATIGVITMFISYSRMLYEEIIFILVEVVIDMVKGHAAGERIMGLLNEDPAVQDSKEALELLGDVARREHTNLKDAVNYLAPMRGEIEYRNVSFCYEPGEYILKDFNLKIAAGERIALVGRTGAGKTTIVNLACRFFEPTEGEILIDGEDYRLKPQQWIHKNLGYVLQQPFLFTGTVAENIKYGMQDATREEIERAAKLVHAHDFIMKLENGYDTMLGLGTDLSGGQRQLISFARAVLRAPALFVLDEATSSVDTETEFLIQEALECLLRGRTSLTVAHRLSTIKNADRILVIEDGIIQESGSHSELMKLGGYYHSLYTNQRYDEGSRELLA